MKKYDGNILRIVSDKDELNERVKHSDYVSAGDELILKMVKAIRWMVLCQRMNKSNKKVLKKLEKYEEANDKTYINAKSKLKIN